MKCYEVLIDFTTQYAYHRYVKEPRLITDYVIRTMMDESSIRRGGSVVLLCMEMSKGV